MKRIRHLLFSILANSFVYKFICWLAFHVGQWIVWGMDHVLHLKPSVDAQLTSIEIIQKNGYPTECHEVTTDDGYILTLHRIPHGRDNVQKNNIRLPVLLMHGIESSSGWWLLLPSSIALLKEIIFGVKNGQFLSHLNVCVWSIVGGLDGKGSCESAYLLADKGFDVWMGNCRGNIYSRKHKHMNSSQKAFWNYSFHEIGYHDVPQSIDYILAKTGFQKLDYVGYSMGTTVGLICLSTKPEYNDKIRKMVLLSPVAHLSGHQGIFNTFIRWQPNSAMFLPVMDYLFDGGPIPVVTWCYQIFSRICSLHYGRLIANTSFAVASRFDDSRNATDTAMSTAIGHMNSSSPFRVYVHMIQLIRSGRFAQRDFGVWNNVDKYGQPFPPLYELERVKCPVHIIHSVGDHVCSIEDVEKTISAMSNCSDLTVCRLDIPDFRHADYVYSVHAKSLVYDRILTYLNKSS